MSKGEEAKSPNWSSAVKIIVALIGIVMIGALLARFQTFIPAIILAGIVAFLIVPVVRTLHTRFKVPWGLAANVCFLLLVLILISASTVTGFAVVQQLQALFLTVQNFLFDLPNILETISQQTYVLGPWELDLSQFDLVPFAEQLLAAVQPLFGQLSAILASLATGAVEWIVRLVFVLAVSYFLTVDYNRIRATVINTSIPGFTDDFRRLRIALLGIWNAFLRGQLLIVLSTGFLTWIVFTILGVRFSIGLGVLGGLAKFVPIVGPTTAGAIGALVALFQPSNWFGLTPLGHALLVVASITLLDQSIDYLLIPRIMGTSLNLHPVIILIGLLIGASLAGILGLLLAAPFMATLLLLGRYIYRKIVDLDPWDPPIDDLGRGPPRESRIFGFLRRTRDKIQKST
jgi:predicted PurR-regulated permease PerM